jgi:hypothetical protein
MDGDESLKTYLRLTHLLRPAVSLGIAVWVLFVADVGSLTVAGVTVDGRIPILVFAAAFATTPLWNSYRPEDLLND